MWRASFSIPSVTSLSYYEKKTACLLHQHHPCSCSIRILMQEPHEKSAQDVSSHFLVGRKRHNTSLAHEYCVPWQYIGFLMVDEIRLLYLTVPLRKVHRRNRTLASSTDVEKLSLKHGIHAPKVHFSSTSATQPKFSGRPEVTGGFARYPNICGTLYQNPNLYSKYQMLRWNILQHCGPASGPYKSLINADVLLGLVISREHCVRILNLYMLSGLPKGNKKDVKQSIHL